MAEPNLAAAVTALIIAYQSARDLLQSIRLLDNHWQKTTEEVAKEQSLMEALKLGESSISRRYTAIYNELGEQYRMGDGVSQEKLFQIAQLVNMRITKGLQYALKFDDTEIDYDRLTQDASLYKRAAMSVLEELRKSHLPKPLVNELSVMSPDVCNMKRANTSTGQDIASVPGTGPFAKSICVEPASRANHEPLAMPSNATEQSARFRRHLFRRKTEREACFPAAPADKALLEHFEWQGSDLHALRARGKRQSRVSPKVWYTCAEVPVVLDVSQRPRKPDNIKLAAWDKWRQDDHLATGHANAMNNRSSSEYSFHHRASSEYSLPSPPPLDQHPAFERLGSPSADEQSSHRSRSSTQSEASTPLSSPASVTESYDWADVYDKALKPAPLDFDHAPPAIPMRSPLRGLTYRQKSMTAAPAPLSPISPPPEHHRTSSEPGLYPMVSAASPVLSANVLLAPISAHLPAPHKSKGYHGLCKGAWATRESTDDGLKLQTRPSGDYTKVSFLQCRFCHFRSSGLAPKSTVVETRVYATAGILYRWAFLAKSHVESKSSGEAAFGCLFCTAQGNGGCVYGDLETLMSHILMMHADAMARDVQEEAKCIFGRVARAHEDFDICIPVCHSRRPMFGLIGEELEA